MKVRYLHKMGNEQKSFSSFEANEIPENIRNIIVNNTAFSKSKSFGKIGLGSPDEIELLNIEFDDGEKKEFKYFNKGIYFMMNGGEEDRPIFQVFTHFMTFDRK